MGIESTRDTPLAEAVRRAGGQSPFARMVGLSQGYVHQLLREGKPLPAANVIRAEQKTGVSRYDLRPDIYPLEDPAPHRDALEPAR